MRIVWTRRYLRELAAIGDYLNDHPQVIATPHIGFVTRDEFDLQFGEIYDQINAFAQGAPINLVA